MAGNALEDGRIVGSVRSVDGAGVVRLECRFDNDAAEVWAALTDSARLGRWLGEVEGDLRVGGELRARFFATGWEGTLRVETCEPPARLLVLTRSEDEPDCVIEATLSPDRGQTLLILEDRGVPLQQVAAYGAGDQVIAEALAAHLAGEESADALARWRELHPAYQERAAALPPGVSSR